VGHHGPWVWIGFTALIAGLLFLDLAVVNRRSHKPSGGEALKWALTVIGIALTFGLFIYWREGGVSALEYYTGYIIELSLSVDNLFVFLLVFQFFNVPERLRPVVLNWGILGAIAMRLVMIVAGAYLITRFEWIIYVFGAFLVYTGVKMFRSGGATVDVEHNRVVRWARKVLPVTDSYADSKFFVRSATGLMATPLLLVLITIEWTDLIFAVDSIPAVFAVTRDPFLVYSSNIFAVIGLRALFFVLSDMIDKFDYLKYGVALVLVFVGLKMLVSYWFHPHIAISLGAIVVILAGSVALSLWKNPAKHEGGS
jgi:tellurite resistance protein TerC